MGEILFYALLVVIGFAWGWIARIIKEIDGIGKIKFYKSLLIEVVETLCSICLYLDRDGRCNHNDISRFMEGHFKVLKGFSEELRGKK